MTSCTVDPILTSIPGYGDTGEALKRLQILTKRRRTEKVGMIQQFLQRHSGVVAVVGYIVAAKVVENESTWGTHSFRSTNVKCSASSRVFEYLTAQFVCRLNFVRRLSKIPLALFWRILSELVIAQKYIGNKEDG